MHFQHKLPIPWVLITIQYVSQTKVVSNLGPTRRAAAVGRRRRRAARFSRQGIASPKPYSVLRTAQQTTFRLNLLAARYLAETALVLTESIERACTA